MYTTVKTMIAALGLCATLSSCNANFVIDGIRGNGSMSSAVRTLPPVHRMVVDGSIDVHLSCSPDSVQRIIVHADANLLDNITTENDNGTLHISSKKGYSTKLPIYVEACIPGCSGIAIEGSADVQARDVKTSYMEVQIEGSGDVDLAGSATKLYVNIDGSGDIRAYTLDADSAEVHINGSGDCNVNVKSFLDVSINGSGDVNYRGDVQNVKKSINGSGDLNRR